MGFIQPLFLHTVAQPWCAGACYGKHGRGGGCTSKREALRVLFWLVV